MNPDQDRKQIVIAPQTEAEILRLYHAEGWTIGTIATQLGVHWGTVQRALWRHGIRQPRKIERPSMIDPFVPFLLTVLEKFPRLTASRLYFMVRQRGYPGQPSHFRHRIQMLRPRRPAEAYLRLATLPGEQAQADWAYFGKVVIGKAERGLLGFVMVLSYSRRIFLEFFLDQRMENFLRGHLAAFSAWGGVPRIILYDNLRSVVLERFGDAIRFHPTLLAFSGHYHFEPRPVGIGKGNEKGRVERSISYIRQSFFAGRSWKGLAPLNEQARQWCQTLSLDRPWPEDHTQTVRAAFEREQPTLMPLPADPFPTQERIEVTIGKTPYGRFDGNDYSVPPQWVRCVLTVVADPERVRFLAGNDVVAIHPRSYSRHETIEDPSHIEQLQAAKRQARQHRGQHRLFAAAPSSQALLVELAQRGDNLGSATAAFLRLLDRYGAAELEAAAVEALAAQSPHPHSVRLLLERRRHENPAAPPLPMVPPQDGAWKHIPMQPPSLRPYDQLCDNAPPQKETPSDEEEPAGDRPSH